jgi:hypothetical protein
MTPTVSLAPPKRYHIPTHTYRYIQTFGVTVTPPPS